MMLRSLLCSLPLLAALAPAQGLVVVPAAASSEGSSFVLFAGREPVSRRQVVVGASELAALSGRQLTALLFRRDANASPGAISAGTAVVTLNLGAAAHGPSRTQSSFAANLPTPQLVFSGSVSLPASPDASARTPAWSGSDVIEIVFSTPWTYAGGDLCIDIQADSTGTDWWPIDAHRDAQPGTVQSSGAACGAVAQWWGETHYVAPADLVVGGTAAFQFNGAANATAILFLGLAPLSSPLGLGFLGAPNCTLDVAPLASFVTAVSAAWTPDVAYGGIAHLDLSIPADPALLAAVIYTQWLGVEQQSFTTSNLLRCQFAGSMPGLGMTTVQQSGSGPVRVHPGMGPVIGFRWQ